MPSKCRYTSDIFSHVSMLHKVLWFKIQEILSDSGLKSPISRDKSMVLFGEYHNKNYNDLKDLFEEITGYSI